jgi:phosphate/sulfate permease
MEGAASVKPIAITNKRLLRQIVGGWTIGPLAGAAISFLLTKAISIFLVTENDGLTQSTNDTS